jgi:hypothetical protein
MASGRINQFQKFTEYSHRRKYPLLESYIKNFICD